MKWKILVLSVAMISPAMAEEAPEVHKISANLGISSQYVYRGLQQTNGNPAISGGIDYAYRDAFYAGTWLSNSSFYSDLIAGSSSSIEVDVYAGYRGKITGDLKYDIGFLHYDFPGTYPAAGLTAADLVKPNSNEIYGSIGYRMVSAKYSRATGTLFGIPNSSGTNYLEINGEIPLGETGMILALHAGKQTFRGISAAGVPNDSKFSYTDYLVGIRKEIAKFVLSVAATTSNAKAAGYTNLSGKNVGAGQVIASVYREF